VDDKTIEDIKFRQGFIEKDSSSPLHLIREKEMEISGRVLAAKKEAEKILSEARRKAAELVNAAEIDGDKIAAEREKAIMDEAEAEAIKLVADAGVDIKKMEKGIADRSDEAASAVVKMVTVL